MTTSLGCPLLDGDAFKAALDDEEAGRDLDLPRTDTDADLLLPAAAVVTSSSISTVCDGMFNCLAFGPVLKERKCHEAKIFKTL